MAWQRPTRLLVIGPCIVEIGRIVIREVQYQLEVNQCRNEEILVKSIMGGCGLSGRGAPGWIMRPCIVEIDRIVIREVQYQLEVNQLKGNFGCAWPMWEGRPRIDCIVIREVQYQLEVNQCRNEEVLGRARVGNGPCIVEIDRIVIRELQYQFEVNQCRNEEVIVKGNFGWPHVEIDRIVIREVQYQFEVNQCRNEEILIKGNFGWVWSKRAVCPRVDNGAMHMVQYQFEENPCRKEEVIVKGNFGWVWSMLAERRRLPADQWLIAILSISERVNGPSIVEIDRIVIREVQYQFEVNRCRNEEVISGLCGWGAPGLIDPIVIREVQYQFEVNRCRNEEVNFQGSNAYSVGGDSGQDGLTDRQTAEIFKKRVDN
ncbi:hypothetical protein DPMN_019634 [Dreissena polymorpha]|uniref:Uncharacterized protein n=1 Tax=Dreissena polymorpha TaxID=45954 RepID=A0A9D4S7I1_DREPO|nr:hypothetical protein DPMN_019634 [Dreissena polymorpha]